MSDTNDDVPENPRLNEVDGDEGMPGEFLDTPANEPGDQSSPVEDGQSETSISDSKGTS